MTKCLLISVIFSLNLNVAFVRDTVLLHDLLIAKLDVFGFDLRSLKVIHAYLNDRIQVTKVGSFYSEILQIIYGVPQDSILGPLLFKVNLIELLLAEHYKSDFSN